ncbi:MAG: 50S ribosomal protein L29 [Alphaproteobacteria bacterium]
MAKQKVVTPKKALVSVSEIYEALYSTKKELFALRLQQATSQLRQTHLLRVKKRECARLLSQLRQIRPEGIKV